MFDRSDPYNERMNSRKKRMIQEKLVKEIVLDEFRNGEGAS
jgi:hypothetical protein